MLMLGKRGAVLDSARNLSRLLHDHNLRGAIINGVAVALHGHVRTTRDDGILAHDSTQHFAVALIQTPTNVIHWTSPVASIRSLGQHIPHVYCKSQKETRR
jgi:hypothetical protein